MIRSRFGPLGLCAVVLGVMAFSANAAQAEVGAKWLLANNSGLIATLDVSLGIEAETTIVKHTSIAGISVLFECKKMAVLGMVLKAEGKIGNGAKFKYSECITKLNGATSAPCEPFAGAEKGVIISNALHGLIVLHELSGGTRDDLIKFLPDEVSSIILTVRMSEECAIGEQVPVGGSLYFKDCENLFLTHLVKHLMEVGPLTELWAINPTHPLTVLGSWWVFLTGAHQGLKWSGDPA